MQGIPRKLALIVALLLLIVSVPAVWATPTPRANHRDPVPEEAWEQVAAGGIGNSNNTVIIAMRVFKSYLYASTQNLTDGASILRSPDGETWSEVVSSGFGDANNRGIYGLAEYDNKLCVGVRNDMDQASLWCSTTGDSGSWTEVVNTGLGNDQRAYWALLNYNNRLWAACETNGASTVESAQLWSYDSATTNWSQEIIPGFDVDMDGDTFMDNHGIYSIAVFGGGLYIGVGNDATGAQVWRRIGSGGPWERVAQDGLGNPDNTVAYTMRVYKDVLYVGTYNTATGAELYATGDGVSWDLVFANGFDDPNNIALWNLIESDGYLYLATQNTTLGSRIYRTTDGRTWTPITLGGFGDLSNTRVWGMAVFSGLNGMHLYAGTDNDTGSEIWRTALPQPEESWIQVGRGGFDDDKNNRGVLDMIEYEEMLYATIVNSTGTQVWRTIEGRTWVQVGQDGFGDPNNVGGYALTEHQGRLFLGTENAAGGIVYRLAENGVDWEAISAPGFGDPNNRAIYALVSFNSVLYAGTWNLADRAEVWRYTGTGTNWTNVSPPDGEFEEENDRIRSMVVYGGQLYIGTYNAIGAEIWRYNGSTWQAVNTDGQGHTLNTQLLTLVPFNGYLYAGYSNADAGGQVWRSQDGMASWQQVNQGGFGRNLVDDPTNSRILSMSEWQGYLYAGTENMVTGGEVWRTAGGATQSDWEQINTDGFSFKQNTGAWALAPFGPHLYAGTYNTDDGAEVWRTDRPSQGPGDPCCAAVRVGIKVQGACWIRVNGTATTPLRAETAGIYDVALPGAGTYDVTVEYMDGNQPYVQPIAVLIEPDGTARITHGSPYTLKAPSHIDEAWLRVADASAIGANNTAVIAMRAFKNYLYASTRNATDGASILRSPDGQTWSAVAQNGFGTAGNRGIYGLVEYGDRLYVGTHNDGGQAEMYASATGGTGTWIKIPNSGLGGNQTAYWSLLKYYDPIVGSDLLWAGCDVASNMATAELWTYDQTTTNWTQEIIPGFDVDMDHDGFGDNAGIYVLAEFQDDLYLGTKNYATGAELWRRSGVDGTWTRVAQNGFGNQNNRIIYAMTVYNNALYVGTYNTATGAELYASRDGDSWENIFVGGFDNPANVAIWRLIESNGYLYLGTESALGGRTYRTVDGGDWMPVSLPGFGNSNNITVLGMSSFEGLGNNYLYAGTNNANGAEIWRTIIPQPEEAWERIEHRGIDDDPNNTTIWSMVEYNNDIYVGTYNPGGGQVWKSLDGLTWVQLGPDGLDSDPSKAVNNNFVDSLVFHGTDLYAGMDSDAGARVYKWNDVEAVWVQINGDGFGTVNNESALAMVSFRGNLYASTYNSTERAKVFRYTGTGTNWINVSPPDATFEPSNWWIDAMVVYNDALYIGTANNTSGGEIWRYNGSTWEPVTTDGFGESDNREVQALVVFDNYLYAGFQNANEGGELWRSADGMTGWQQVNQNGFGRSWVDDPDNSAIRSLAVWEGYLYAGTTNTTTGGEVWRTTTGSQQDDWSQVGTDGFGSRNNGAIMTLCGMGDAIYAGTENPAAGAEIWRTGLPGQSTGRFAQVVNVTIRTSEGTTITVSGAMNWSYEAPARGLYRLPLPFPGVYHVACGCGHAFDIYLDAGASYSTFLPIVMKGDASVHGLR